MKIATWNVNGIRARQAQFAEWVEADRPDVICLQELKAAADKIPEQLTELPGYYNYWHGSGGYSGVSLHLRHDAFDEPPLFDHPDFDFENRMVQATIGNLTIASIYVPNGGKNFEDKLRFIAALQEYTAIAHAAGRDLILCGDMNVTRTEQDVHPSERKVVIGQLPDERRLFEAVMQDRLVDVGRTLDPDNDRLFTWWAPWRQMRQRNIGWRIDYILASHAIAQTASACEVFRETGTSDHAPVIATLDL